MPELATDSDLANEQQVGAEALRRWLASGTLQSPTGAFCAWLDQRDRTLAFEYPEITGYALTWLAGLPDIGARELEAGTRAADWLLARLRDGDRSARTGWDGGAAYNFDLGMISAGLTSFGQLTAEKTYGGLGVALARELAAQTLSEGGMRPVAPGPESSRPDEWSTAGRPHLLKCTQALLLAGEIEAARSLTAGAGDLQADDGHFVTQPGDRYVMLHPHLYTVEGLWMSADAHIDEGAVARARRATEWAWQHQLPSGGMPRWVATGAPGTEVEHGPEQTDVTAQAIRAAILLDVDPPGLANALARLRELAIADGDGAALVYAPARRERHLNAWVTMFGAQALTVASEGAGALAWNTIV
jgi:hypothetical protein